MEAEAREILVVSLAAESPPKPDPEAEKIARQKRIDAVEGIWKERYEGKSTDDIMKELRGDD